MTESAPAPGGPPPSEPPPRRLEYAIRLPHRGWVWYAFLASLAAAIWFLVVLYGEVNNWTAQPDQWALLSTSLWALVGMALLVLTATYFLLLLIRREVPRHAYVVPPTSRRGVAPGSSPEPDPSSGKPLEPEPTHVEKLSRKERKAFKKAGKHTRKEERRAAKFLAKHEKRRA